MWACSLRLYSSKDTNRKCQLEKVANTKEQQFMKYSMLLALNMNIHAQTEINISKSTLQMLTDVRNSKCLRLDFKGRSDGATILVGERVSSGQTKIAGI